MDFRSVCVFLTFVAASFAQFPSLGWCPDYFPMEDFDIDKFLGRWYEVEHYFTFSDFANRCVVTDYALGPDGRVLVSNEVTNRITGVKRLIGGNIVVGGKGNEGKLSVRYTTTTIPSETTLTVLESDYDSYAVVWSCNSWGPIHAENVWVMTRERLPSSAAMQAAYGVLDKFKIGRTFFVKTNQEDCRVVASELNVANRFANDPDNDYKYSTDESLKSEEPESTQKKSEDVKIENPTTVAEHILSSVEDSTPLNNSAAKENIISVIPDSIKNTPSINSAEDSKQQ